ncbi:MAG: hypothetical protein GY795_38595 [Desulfobacterales bacterium]|nr:hypothetical protein [Desulfobacterales bacterium]
MKFWQSRVQCQNFISALLQTVNRKIKDATYCQQIADCIFRDIIMKKLYSSHITATFFFSQEKTS